LSYCPLAGYLASTWSGRRLLARPRRPHRPWACEVGG